MQLMVFEKFSDTSNMLSLCTLKLFCFLCYKFRYFQQTVIGRFFCYKFCYFHHFLCRFSFLALTTKQKLIRYAIETLVFFSKNLLIPTELYIVNTVTVLVCMLVHACVHACLVAYVSKYKCVIWKPIHDFLFDSNSNVCHIYHHIKDVTLSQRVFPCNFKKTLLHNF